MSEATDSTVIGFVGLGNMGGPMAAALIEAGYPVTGYDPDPAAMARFQDAGGVPAQTAAAAIGAGRLSILVLPTSSVVEEVVAQARDSIGPGSVIVDMSSSEPMRTTRLAEQVRSWGASLVDAPISGGVRGAVSRTLTVMVGGDEESVAEVREVLTTFGRVIEVGPVGAGHAVKALNNWLSATHLWATSEAMVIGQRFGLDPGTMIDVFNGSSGRSGSTEVKWPKFILPGGFDSGFGLRLMLKDVRIAIDLAEQLGLPTALGTCVTERWQEAADGLPPDADHTEVAAWIAGERGR